MDPIAAIAAARVVPVVVLENAADARPLAHALMTGGLPVMEVTFRTAAAREALAEIATIDGVVAGAGTVVTPDQVDQAVDVGATFLVSPGISVDVVTRAQERGVPILPGVATPSDLMTAISLGLDLVKFFPAGTLGGPAAIKALAAPFGGIKFVPTGGITTANLGEYLSVPAVLAAGGSWMVDKALVAAGDFDEITARTRAAIELAQTF